MSIQSEHEFNPEEYQSMDKTVRALLKLTPEDQPIEYKELAMLEVNHKNTTFDAAFQLEAIKEFDAVVEIGMSTAKKYHFRYLEYLFEQLLGLTDKPEYDPKDYPLPDGIDLEPYVQQYIDKFGTKDKKTAPKKTSKPGSRRRKRA